MITVLPLSQCRGAQEVDCLAAGAGNGSLGFFRIDCGLLYEEIKCHLSTYLTGIHIIFYSDYKGWFHE